MQEIVDAILLAEEESARLIETARRNAAEQKERVDAEVAGMIKNAREEAQARIRGRVETAHEQSRAERDRTVAEAQQSRASFARAHQTALAPIVEKIVDLVIIPEYESRGSSRELAGAQRRARR